MGKTKALHALACAAMAGTLALAGCAQAPAQQASTTSATTAASTTATASAQNRETMYQVSLLQSLTEGDFEGSVTVGEYKQHGDTGIGTFDGLNGELVMLDGQVWQAAGDGSVNLMDDAETIPFGNTSFLDADETLDVSGIENFNALLEKLNARVAALGVNNFYLVRIDGTFAEMNVRSEYKQNKPYPTIVDALAADQTFFDLTQVEGSMVGVYCPPYLSSLNSAGWHLHFVSADHSKGGHVLNCKIDNATATIDLTKNFDLTLPTSEKFESTDFTVDRSSDVKKAETNE